MKAKIIGGVTVIFYRMDMEESKFIRSDGEIREIAFTDSKIDC